VSLSPTHPCRLRIRSPPHLCYLCYLCCLLPNGRVCNTFCKEELPPRRRTNGPCQTHRPSFPTFAYVVHPACVAFSNTSVPLENPTTTAFVLLVLLVSLAFPDFSVSQPHFPFRTALSLVSLSPSITILPVPLENPTTTAFVPLVLLVSLASSTCFFQRTKNSNTASQPSFA
jgi:hypothetical protein